MKTKFILWLDSELLTFAIAYYLKKTYDCELYAIIDITNGTKNFFEKQNLVEFEKTWFYFDHVHPQNSKPDYEYLKNITMLLYNMRTILELIGFVVLNINFILNE